MRKLRVAAASLLTLALCAGSPAVRGETLADQLPGDAIGYASWAGTDALGGPYQGSNLKGFVDALRLPEFFREHFQKELAKNNQPEKAADVKLIQDVVAAISASPSALYVGPMVGQTNGQEIPEFILLSKVGADRARDLAGRLGQIIEREKKPDQPAGGAAANGDLLVVHVGSSAQDKLKRVTASDNLAANEGFRKAMTHVKVGAQPAAALYVDGATVVSLVAAGVEKSDNAQARQFWPALREGMGINALRSVAWAGNFDGKNWQSSTFVGMTDRRVGVMAFMDNAALSDTALRFIPATATTAGAFRFNGNRLLADVQRTAAAISPDAPRQVDRALAQVFAITGVDVKLDLFPALGDEFIFYGSPDAAGNSIRGFTLVNKLKDPAKAETAFTALENIINMTLAQQMPNAKVQFRTEKLSAPFANVTAHVIAAEQVSPAWAIHEGVFYFAMSLPTLQSALERGGGAAGPTAQGSLLENPQFAALRQKLGQEKFAAFSYDDLVRSAPETYELVNRALERAAKDDPSITFKLPPLDKLVPTLGPVLQVSWTDADGFHMRDHGPVPFANQLSPINLMFLRASEGVQPRAGGANLP